jgi:hypothetical protein
MFRSVEARIIATTIGIIMPIIFAVIKPRNARGSKIGVFFLLIGTFGFMLCIMNSIADRIF